MKKITIVIPCFNEEEVLPKLFKRVDAIIEQHSYKWEIICINDGSTDKTVELLSEKAKRDKTWNYISFSRNFGHQTAVSCGLFHSTGDAVVVIDADLQDPPEEIVKLIKKWEEGYQVVYAIRKKRKESFLKKISYWGFYRVLSFFSDVEIPVDSGDFSLMDRNVVDIINAMPERNRYVRGLRAWSGFRQIGVEYERQEREAGEPKYSFKKLFKLASDGILSFSSRPLTLAFYFGLLISFISFLGMIFTLVQRIFSEYFSSIGIGPVPGFATIVISVLFLGGVQLIFLGIIGNYLGRVYEEVKQRPLWVIEDSVGVKTGMGK